MGQLASTLGPDGDYGELFLAHPHPSPTGPPRSSGLPGGCFPGLAPGTPSPWCSLHAPGYSSACRGHHGIQDAPPCFVHRCGCDRSSRHDMGPADYRSGDTSRGTLTIPQGAQGMGQVRAGQAGAGGGHSWGWGGGHEWGEDCPLVGGKMSGMGSVPWSRRNKQGSWVLLSFFWGRDTWKVR